MPAGGGAMKVMILAAGTGARLRPLTERLPKPLIRVGPESLIERHLRRLADAGFREIVINVCYKKQTIMDALGDGENYGVRIIYSDEGDVPLETGGGIRKALPLLGDGTWLVVNADVYTDWQARKLELPAEREAHLLLVDNPPHHPGGDFSLGHGLIGHAGENRLTYAGIGYYRPSLFATMPEGRFKLAQALKPAIARGVVGGEHCRDFWMDAGMPASLEALQKTVGGTDISLREKDKR